MTGWLRRVLSRFDARALPSRDWLRQGWPRAALLLLPSLPALAAGPLRYVSGLPMAWSLALASLSSLVLAALLLPSLAANAQPRRQAIVANLALVALCALAALLPHNRDFHGLPYYASPDGLVAIDGGYHVGQFWTFVRRTPAVYSGCVMLYSLWDALQRLGSRHLVAALQIGFAFGRVVVAAAPCVVGFALLHAFRDRPRAWLAGAAALVASGALVQVGVALPLETFDLMGGFWPHLLGLVPLMALWVVDALTRPRWLRVVLLLLAGALYRYAYAFNLPEVAGTIAVLLVWEAAGRGLAVWARLLLLGGAATAIYGAEIAFAILRAYTTEWGWIVNHNITFTHRGELLTSIALALVVTPWARTPQTRPGLVRALRFPVLFAAGNAIAYTLLERPPTSMYYLQKHDLHAAVLVSGAAVVGVAWCAASAVAAARARVFGACSLAAALALFGQWQMHDAYASIVPAFREQALGPPYAVSRAWVMPDAVRFMERKLASGDKLFGGYLGQQYPTFVTTNGLFDYADPRFLGRPVPDGSARHCIFWDGASRWPNFDALREKGCVAFTQPPLGRVEACAACY